MKNAEKIGLFGRHDWLAIGTLAATTLMASSRVAIAAVTKDGGAGSPGQRVAVGTLPVKRFDIAPGRSMGRSRSMNGRPG
jgi:hypothetical protein